MTLIRKYATPLTLIAILFSAIAAPFLLPESPDSPVFRSGTLALILLMACFQPVSYALRHADLRTLACSAVFGLLFASSLSLGAELRFYGGLLPGMGSMIRRLAVPVLATPLLSGLAARMMLLRPRAEKRLQLSMGVYMAILLLCWLPLLIAYYPGMFNYDFHTEYQQFLDGTWDARHPLLYIVITYAFYALGRALDNPTLGILLVSLIRMITFAAALAYSCTFVQRRAPRWVPFAAVGLYGLLPVFSVMAVSSAKDTPFAAAVLVLSLLSWEALESPETFFSSRRKMIIFIISILFTWHMRKNGIAVLLMLPLLIAAIKGYQRKMFILCTAGIACSALLAFGMNAILHPVDQPSFQTYSLPAQQLVRAYHLGSMTEDEKEELRSWYVDSDWGLQLLPHLADAAKGSLDPQKLEADRRAFMDLWARVGRKNVRVYTEAFLMLNMGSWYPDDTSHSTVYQPYGLDKGYLQTDEYDLSASGISKPNRLPAVRQLLEKICRRNAYQKYPVIAQLLCTATPFWLIIFSCAALIARRKTFLLPAAAGTLALWLSYLLGPCTLARYMLPLFCLAPVIAATALSPYSASGGISRDCHPL